MDLLNDIQQIKRLIHINIGLAQLNLCLLNLLLKRLVLVRNVVEGQDHVSEATAEEACEDDEGVEWELEKQSVCVCR